MTDDLFVVHRSLLFTIAYEMLGSATDAEDVVQETWLRWVAVDQREIDAPRAYMVRIVARLALDRLRSVSRRREDYIGEWLPEPLSTSPDWTDDLELAERISIAMLTVLETLSPAERAVFVLREVFDTPYPEIAEVVGKTEDAVRQIAHRARDHVAARRPRVHVDRAEQLVVVEKFLAAIATGDVHDLLEVLAPDVIAIADGGGITPATRKPITGAEKLAPLLALVAKKPDLVVTTAWFNGMPGARLTFDHATVAVSLVIEAGRISHIYAITNPHKLSRLDTVTELRR